jgi:hypothetical protein
MADSELVIARKILELLRTGKLVKGDKSLDQAEAMAFESSGAVLPRDDVRHGAWLAIATLRKDIEDRKNEKCLLQTHAMSIMMTERWIEARA